MGGDNVLAIAAGLPNIEGDLIGASGGGRSFGYNSGLFESKDPSTYVGAASSGYSSYCNVNFNAKRANALYGASETVQPPSIVLIPQIKY